MASKSRFSRLSYVSLLQRHRLAIIFLGFAVLFPLYARNVTKNPPGFYLDESSIAYNAYTISKTGQDEFGVSWPLYFRAFGEYKNPVYIYLLAGVFKIFGPSIFAARLLSSILVFAAALLLGLLAARLTSAGLQTTIAVIVALTALLTPWLFELGRLVFEVAIFPLVLAAFLLALHHWATTRKWRLASLWLASCLALVTYSYSTGRMLGPLLALGLVFFLSRQNWRKVVAAWSLYGLTLIPLLIFSLRDPGALSARFQLLTYIKPDAGAWQILTNFVTQYLSSWSLTSLLLVGDTNARHHVFGMGSVLVITFVLAAVGIFVVLRERWRDPWWRFVLYGLLISPVPASLTLDIFHTLRLAPLPVFLIVLTIPALEWLLKSRQSRFEKMAPLFLIAAILVQGAMFQAQFQSQGPLRERVFDAQYPEVFASAITVSARPIYLIDELEPSGYIHAYWYGTLEGINASQFVRFSPKQNPPPGALVIGSKAGGCQRCQLILRLSPYVAYRTF